MLKEKLVALPLTSEGKEWPLPPAVKHRETELLKNINDCREKLIQASHDPWAIRSQLDAVLIQVENNDRLAFTEYLATVNKTRTDHKAEMDTKVKDLTQKHTDEMEKIKKETSQQITFVQKRNEELQTSIGRIEKRFSEHLRIFRSLAYKIDTSSNYYRKLMEQGPENIVINPHAEDHMKNLLCGGLVIEKRTLPLSPSEWEAAFDEKGKIKDAQAIRIRIFQGGIDPAIRPIVWKYLLNYFPWESTSQEREELKKSKASEYQKLKDHWQQLTTITLRNWSDHDFQKRLDQIHKDVVRTDRDEMHFKEEDSPYLKQLNDILATYGWYNWSVGYVQGMNDMLAPILTMMNNEVDSFWCFSGQMTLMEGLFKKNQPAVQTMMGKMMEYIGKYDKIFYAYMAKIKGNHIFFAFRWFLLYFKREFTTDDARKIWEVIWTHQIPDEEFAIWIALAMLWKQRETILNQQMDFDEILRHMSNISLTMDAGDILDSAIALYNYFIRDGNNHQKDEEPTPLNILTPLALSLSGNLVSQPSPRRRDTPESQRVNTPDDKPSPRTNESHNTGVDDKTNETQTESNNPTTNEGNQ